MTLATRAKALVWSLLTARRIKRDSNLPEHFRSDVASTFLRLNVTRLRDTASVVGYEVTHRGADEFRFLFNELFVEACYFFDTQVDRPLIIDCGSNIGMSILFFKKLYPNARIIGFEPDPVTFKTLRENIARNSLSDITVHCCALSNQDGTTKLYRATLSEQSDLTMSTLRERHDGLVIAVDCRRLSSFIAEEVDLLKIDVEGAEQQVLLDLVETDKLKLIKKIHLEYHHHIDTNADTLSIILNLLEQSGFGYQIKANSSRWPTPQFQDISIFCYQRPYLH